MKDAEIAEAQRTIAELTRTPIGRRWLLKMGVSTAAALALPAWAAAQGPPAPAPAAPRGRRGTVFHFALGPAVAALPDLTLVVDGGRIPLTPHSRSSRSALQSQGTLWRKLRLSELTHFAAVPLARDRVHHMTVYGTHNRQTVVVAQKFYAPPTVTGALASAAFLLEGSYRSVTGPSERLSALGLDASQLTSVREVVDLDTALDPHQSAIALSMHHPNVGTKGPTANSATQSLLGGVGAVTTLGKTIASMPNGYGTNVLARNRDRTPSTITIKGTTSTFSTTQLSKDTKFTSAARAAFQASLRQVRNTGSLGIVLDKPLDQSPPDSSTWHQPEGIVVRPTPHTGLGAGVDVQVQNPGMVHGTQVQLNGAFSGGQLSVKLFNNFVRWVWVYVQYLKADGTNLSLSPNATFPDTKHAISVGLLPQVFTVLGVPLWDTNTLEPTLTFPAEATSARLLFCGLGSDAVDGGWRQYFPPNAYGADFIGPQDEVLVSSLLTGIVTLGLTSFMLVIDIDAAVVFGVCAKAVKEGRTVGEILQDFKDLLAGPSGLGGAEDDAIGVLAGGAAGAAQNVTTADAANIWNTVGSIAGVIPKILFGALLKAPVWAELAGATEAQEVAQKIVEAIPVLGVVVGVLEVLGDLATLAEAIAETATSPWVIANQISLTYTATVTVSPDPRLVNPIWPLTAASWRIEASIEGTPVLQPVTNTIDPDVKGDLVIPNLTVPFGGATITWAFTMLDGEKNQVGTATLQLKNDDSANPPTDVKFAITELPEAIKAQTVFTRTDTTTFSSKVGGYIWSKTLPPNRGTVANPGVQEVTGVAIATRLGVAGIVWKQDDKYWLRGVPVAESGNTIHLGTATHQGFDRRPFLLFDSLVGPNDLANHVLLEPDDRGTAGYHVRRLTINPTTGDLTWDPNTSYGFFALPVSAAALHSSGWIVAIHTDTGRVGRMLPAITALQPPLARYTAGAGSEIGLLQSPTAVAVTNPGIVIVLEAGASQLAAFDLNGNPARYFGTSSPAAFTLPLPQPATYLDVAVDGSDQIYVLSFGGDGSQGSDYRIDVYTPNGTPLATNSPGTNVPHIAVDYWRSIFAANYTALLDESGQPHVDPSLAVREPSLSRFDPS